MLAAVKLFLTFCLLYLNHAAKVDLNTKLLVATGLNHPNSDAKMTSEVVDLLDPESTCTDLPYRKGIDIHKATGGLLISLDGEPIPLVCGGSIGTSSGCCDISNECFVISTGNPTFSAMMESRNGAASAVLDDGARLWITGGSNSQVGKLNSTEYISNTGQAIPGPELPEAMSAHCLVMLDDSTGMVINRGSSWIYNHWTNSWNPGPELIKETSARACGTVIDGMTGVKIVVAAGIHFIIVTFVAFLRYCLQVDPDIHCPYPQWKCGYRGPTNGSMLHLYHQCLHLDLEWFPAMDPSFTTLEDGMDRCTGCHPYLSSNVTTWTAVGPEWISILELDAPTEWPCWFQIR